MKGGKLLQLLAGGGAFACLVVMSAVYGHFWLAVLSNPFSISYEGHVLWAALALSRGQNIYSQATLSACPWAVIIYPPLYMTVGALLFKLVGPAAWVLRLVSMMSTAAAAAFFFKVLRECAVERTTACLGVVFLLSFVGVFICSPVARVDMMSFMLSLWALERFCSGWQSGSSRIAAEPRYWVASALLLLASLSKYQAAIPALAVVLFSFLNGRRRLAGELLAAWVVPVAFVSLLLELATGGYLDHQTFLKNVPWSASCLAFHATNIGTDYLKLAVGSAVLLASIIMRRKLPEMERLPYCLIVLSVIFSAYTMGIPSAATNHLLYLWLAFSWWCAMAVSGMPRWVALVVAAAALTNVPVLAGLDRFMNAGGRRDHSRLLSEEIPSVRMKGKLVLSEDPFGAAVLGAVPAIVDGASLTNAWRLKPAGLDPLVGMINRREFEVIVINELDDRHGGGVVRWPPEVVAAIKENYEATGTTRGENLRQIIYVPGK